MAPAPDHCTCLLLLSALISGVRLESKSSEAGLIYRPVLQPQESIPPTGTYMLRNPAGVPCIRVTLGAEFMVLEKKTWYFSLDPSRVVQTGTCGAENAILSLTLPNNSASLLFYFVKDKKFYYVKKITAHLYPVPVCKNCTSRYMGLVDHEKLFVSKGGRSFKCNSEILLHLSSTLRLKLVPLQMQAFSVPKGEYGKEVECWPDYNKRVLPIIIGGVIVGLLLIALLSYIIIRDRRRIGYESL